NILILKNIPAGVISLNMNEEITSLNPYVENLFYQQWRPLKSLKDFPDILVKKISSSLNEKIYYKSEEVIVPLQDNQKILSFNTNPLLSDDNHQIGLIITLLDITKIKKLEERLVISSRLAALGEMIAGVAHQIRNPLAIMKVSGEMLRDDFEVVKNKKNYSKLIHTIINEIETLNIVVNNFLDFARPHQVELESYSIQEIISNSLESIPLYDYPDCQIIPEIEDNLPDFLIDKSLMEQVIANLVLNALQSSPDNGRIKIRATNPGKNLVIEIIDNGPGMDEMIRKKIFDPFFTTKDKGTGLGLSIAHRIIESHGGNIDVITEPGKGTIFKIVLG
ncbi:MAG: ATP-binding protein, partial [Spirochaetes bacterium]|nr:ATP-binding protein [Spirochaetota bacterium]